MCQQSSLFGRFGYYQTKVCVVVVVVGVLVVDIKVRVSLRFLQSLAAIHCDGELRGRIYFHTTHHHTILQEHEGSNKAELPIKMQGLQTKCALGDFMPE